MSTFLQPHGLQHARLPCPSLSPEVCSNSCPLSQWSHPTISSSVTTFSSCPQSFLALGSFPVSRLFTSGGQNIEASPSASILPMNIQGWFPLGLTGFISLQFKGLSRVFSSTTIQKHPCPLYIHSICFFCFPNQWPKAPSHNSVRLTLCMQASHSQTRRAGCIHIFCYFI